MKHLVTPRKSDGTAGVKREEVFIRRLHLVYAKALFRYLLRIPACQDCRSTAQEVKPRVPSPPPSPPKREDWEQSPVSAKKGKKQIEKAIAAGKPVDRGYFRTMYGDQVQPLASLLITSLSVHVEAELSSTLL
jgi:hypothetical protein